MVSTLDEADGKRDAVTRDLFTLSTGYTASPFAEVKSAAGEVCAEKVAAQIKVLSGVAELVAQLREA